ncbi:MAG: hypothetical protein KDA61_19505 [Planctomycetales bacterium]|nr:hypothetical protein [Planctomycetales bacterium]
MSDILFQYEKVNPTSWAYLSSLLTIALFFKFNRVLSVRNFDLLLLILLAPGLLLVQYGMENGGGEPTASSAQRWGFTWLFVVGMVWMVRLLCDPGMLRRPLLPPNLNVGGLNFLGSALLFFLATNVVTGPVSEDVKTVAQSAETLQSDDVDGEPQGSFELKGPGYFWLHLLPRVSTQKLIAGGSAGAPDGPLEEDQQRRRVRDATVRVMAIASQVAIVVGLVTMGIKHFDNPAAGVSSAVLYLLLPYTALWTGSVQHALPAALLVWAVVLYRVPWLSGMMLGLACGTIYYPAFLLPLWCSFYWDRGLKRFLGGVIGTIGALVATLAITAGSPERFLEGVRQMFGIRLPTGAPVQGIWQYWQTAYRLPILALFLVLAFSFAAWPARKNLGTLISCTAALMLGSQFWHANEGGLYIAWYLPLTLLTIHRPNLEDRRAVVVVSEGYLQRRQRAKAST